MDTCVYMWLSPSEVHLKLLQQCQSATHQYNTSCPLRAALAAHVPAPPPQRSPWTHPRGTDRGPHIPHPQQPQGARARSSPSSMSGSSRLQVNPVLLAAPCPFSPLVWLGRGLQLGPVGSGLGDGDLTRPCCLLARLSVPSALGAHTDRARPSLPS